MVPVSVFVAIVNVAAGAVSPPVSMYTESKVNLFLLYPYVCIIFLKYFSYYVDQSGYHRVLAEPYLLLWVW